MIRSAISPAHLTTFTTGSSVPTSKGLKILLIAPTIFRLPLQGYGGTEAIVLSLAEEYTRYGHQATVVAPEGSVLPDGIDLLPVDLGQTEEAAFAKYRSRLTEFDIIHDHSLAGDTPLLVRVFGIWEKTNFADLWGRLAQLLPVHQQGNSEVIDLQPGILQVHTYYRSLFPAYVSQISRHANETLYKVQATHGIHVSATEGHGLFTEIRRKPLQIKPIPASQTLGQRLVRAKHLPCNIPDTTYLPAELERFDGYIRGPAVAARVGANSRKLVAALVAEGHTAPSAASKVSRWKHHAYMPATMARVTGNSLAGEIYTHHQESIPFPVSLSAELLTFLGLWLADGCYNTNGVNLCAGTAPEVEQIVSSISHTFHGSYSPSSYRPDVTFLITCSLLKKVMTAAGFSGTSRTKRLPRWVFNLSDRQVGYLLRGLIEGDGCVSEKEIILASVNHGLIEDARFLLWRLGIDSALNSRYYQTPLSPTKSTHYRLCIPRRDFDLFAEKVGLVTDAKKSKLAQRSNGRVYGRRANIRGTLVQAVTPEKIAPWVYDFTVPEYERFFANSILAHNTFGSWCYLESVGVDPPLPIVKTFHTDPSIWSSPPPVPRPCLVGISTNHARRLSLAYGVATRRVYNGIDLKMYSPPPESSKRNGRLLWLGRYTPEKDPLSAMQLAKRLRIPLDCYGDTQIVSDPSYIDRCRAEADGLMVRWYPGVSREKTVELYRTYRALLYTPAWWEPFGLILAEAMACGMPVLTLDRGSTPELVADGVAGYVRDDVSGLETIIKEGCLASIKSDDCRKTAERFSKQQMAKEYLGLFAQVRLGHLW